MTPDIRPDDSDLTYDALEFDDAPPRAGQLLAGLAVLIVAVLGVPAVWADLRSGSLGLEVVFFPVLGLALGYLAVARR